MMRQAQHQEKKLPVNLAAWTPECSWRASIAPASWTSSGLRAPHKRRMRRRATYRDRWCFHRRKKTFSRIILVLGVTLIFLYRSTEDPPIVRVILAPKPCNFRRIEKKGSHANLSTNAHISRIMRVSLANTLQILDVSSQRKQKKTGAMLLFFKKTVCTCHPCTKGHAKFPCAKKKNVQLIPCRRENRHSCEGSPTICGRLFRDIHTSGRAVEGSYVSPLTTTMGDLSGSGRGGDTSGVSSAPSLIIARLRARALALDLACGTEVFAALAEVLAFPLTLLL